MNQKRGIGKIALAGIIGVVIIVALIAVGAAASLGTKTSSTTTTSPATTTSPTSSTTTSSSSTTSQSQPNSSGILAVTCANCTPKTSGDSQYLVTISWNIDYSPNTNVNNVSQFQTQANGSTIYLVTTTGPGVPYNNWFADWSVQDQSASGGVLTATFTLSSGIVVSTQSTQLFPDIVQGNSSNIQAK